MKNFSSAVSKCYQVTRINTLYCAEGNAIMQVLVINLLIYLFITKSSSGVCQFVAINFLNA